MNSSHIHSLRFSAMGVLLWVMILPYLATQFSIPGAEACSIPPQNSLPTQALSQLLPIGQLAISKIYEVQQTLGAADATASLMRRREEGVFIWVSIGDSSTL
jgi:hypothetical protein